MSNNNVQLTLRLDQEQGFEGLSNTLTYARQQLQRLIDSFRDRRRDEAINGIDTCMSMVEDFHERNKVAVVKRVKEWVPDEELDRALMHASTALMSHAIAFQHKFLGELRGSRAHLVMEEVAEWLEALATGDEIKILDAMADLQYVLFGSAVSFDLPLGEAFVEVHASNMTKEKQPDDPHAERLRSKGPNYRAPDLRAVLELYRRIQYEETLHDKDNPRFPGDVRPVSEKVQQAMRSSDTVDQVQH